MAAEFQVTDKERKELLASGNHAFFDNRVGWAKTYLKKAGLLDSPKRATFVITQIIMIDYNLGCTTQQIYVLKKFDIDYFGEE